MARKEEIEKAMKESVSETVYASGWGITPKATDLLECAFIKGAKWADKTMIEKACKCYCDDICDKGRCGMCFHKHDGKGQVKNTFQYNECNDLKLIRKAMEE